MKKNSGKNFFPLSCEERGRGEELQYYYSRIYKTYDRVNTLFTFGLDKKWRKYTVQECLKHKPKKILDLCCGTGDLAIALEKFSAEKPQITGYDLNEEMLNIARIKASKENVHPEFIRGDAGAIPFGDNTFDCITIGFGFRNLTWENPSRNRHISEMARILKPGGRLFILESARPDNPVIGFFYSVYLKFFLVPLGGLLSGDWNAYRYLAGSSVRFYDFKSLEELLKNFALELHLNKKFLFGAANLLVAIKTGL